MLSPAQVAHLEAARRADVVLYARRRLVEVFEAAELPLPLPLLREGALLSLGLGSLERVESWDEAVRLLNEAVSS